MKCRAIIAFSTKRGEIPAGSIVNLPDAISGKMAGKIQAMVCRACGHTEFRQGIGTHRSCDMCQVPEFPIIGKPKKA